MKLRSKQYGAHQLLNPEFRYVPAAQTDIRKTIARERRRLEEEARKNRTEAAEKVRRLKP